MAEDDQAASNRESAGSETVDSPFFAPRRFSLMLAAAGAIEGAVVGFIHGGFPNDFCGAVIGCAIGAVMAPFVWKVHREVRILAPALIAVALLEIGGSLAIDLLAETYPWEAA
jgi:hypothetical protein